MLSFQCFNIFVLFSGSQDLNRPAPPAYNKFSSLDRRALARRHPNQTNQPQLIKPNQSNQLISNAPNQIKLSTFSPNESKENLPFIKLFEFIIDFKFTIHILYKTFISFLLMGKANRKAYSISYL